MKTRALLSAAIIISALATGNHARGDTTNATAIVIATIRDGTSINTDYSEFTNGYTLVKYSIAGSAAKSYFQFDLTGMGPNTNAAATFTISRFSNSQTQHVQLWGLNQEYAGFANTITWNTAQANETNSNSMLTNPTNPYTATLILDTIVPSSFTTFPFTLPGGSGGWGRFLTNNKIVLVLTSTNDPNNLSNGLRIHATNSASLPTLTISTTIGNQPPTVSGIPNQSLPQAHTSAQIPFTIGDKEDPADWLSVWATTSDENIVSSGLIEFSGSPYGSNRWLRVTVGHRPGSATVTVHVMDSVGTENQSPFTVTVTPDPVISAVPTASTLVGTPTPAIAFTVGAFDTPLANLAVAGFSANPNLVPDSGIVIPASTSSNRTVTVTPVAGKDGVAPLTLWVSNGTDSNSTSFAVMVVPSLKDVFTEHFDYADGNLNPLSANFWALRTAGTTKVTVTNQQAILRSSGGSWESLLAPLAGGPYPATNRPVFYTSLKAMWTSMPRDSTGPFLHLEDGTGNLLVKIHMITNTVTDGFFRLGIASGPGNGYVDFPRDLTTNITYSLVARYDPASGSSALWIDAKSETETNVVASDATVGAVANVGLRQQAGIGTIQVDDLKISLAVKPLIFATRQVGADLQIDFAAGAADATTDFGVTRATDVIGPYAEATAAITSLGAGNFRATVPIAGGQGFFRVKRQPVSFQ